MTHGAFAPGARGPLGHDRRVSAASQVLALIAALIHVEIFVLESVLWMRPAVHRRFLVRSRDEASLIRPFMLNQGFYNLFLAAGILVGLVLLRTGSATAGRAVVVFCCASILAAAVVLLGTERKLLRAALVQGVPPALALALLPF